MVSLQGSCVKLYGHQNMANMAQDVYTLVCTLEEAVYARV